MLKRLYMMLSWRSWCRLLFPKTEEGKTRATTVALGVAVGHALTVLYFVRRARQPMVEVTIPLLPSDIRPGGPTHTTVTTEPK
jgi:hypothetical protein